MTDDQKEAMAISDRMAHLVMVRSNRLALRVKSTTTRRIYSSLISLAAQISLLCVF